VLVEVCGLVINLTRDKATGAPKATAGTQEIHKSFAGSHLELNGKACRF
jgi:hypothetical protein